MEKVKIGVEVKTKDAENSLSALEKELKKVGEAGDNNRDAFNLLDDATGGYARRIKDLGAGLAGGIKSVKNFAKGLKGLRGALISTGIGALVVALGLIVAYWDDIIGLINGATSEQQKNLEVAEQTVAASERQQEVTSQMENTLRLQGLSEKDILELKKKQVKETITNLEIQLEQQKSLKKSQIEASKRNKKIAMGIIAFLTAPIVVLLGLVDGLTNSLATLGILSSGTNLTAGFLDMTSSLLFDPEEVGDKADESIQVTEDKLRKLKNTEAGYILQSQKDRKKSSNDRKKADEDAEKERLAALERIRKGGIATEAQERAEKLKAVQDEYAALIAEADKYKIAITELETARDEKLRELRQTFKDKDDADLLAEQEKKLAQYELDKETEELTFDEQRALINTREAALLSDEFLTQEQRTDMAGQFSDARKEIADKEFAGKMAAAQGYASALGDVAGVIGEETAAGKAMAAAASLINTYASIAGNLRAFSGVPVPGYAIAQAIATGAVGFMNVKKILSTKVPKSKGGRSVPSGGGGGGGVGGAASMPPSFNVVGSSDTSQLADAIGGQTQQPVQAFVVSNDITTAQSLENNIVEGATLG